MSDDGGDPFMGSGSVGSNSSGGITNATIDMNSHSAGAGHPFQSIDKGMQAIGSLFQALNPGAALSSLQHIPGGIVGGKIPGLFGGGTGKG